MPGPLPRLTRRAEFLRAASRGRKASRPGLMVQALAVPGEATRLGFTATKKIGNAVRRNRAKRRLREAARLLLAAAPPAGWNLVLIARDGTALRPFGQLLGDLRGALRQAGVPELSAAPPAGPVVASVIGASPIVGGPTDPGPAGPDPAPTQVPT
jgi:ribonuclease P protein component